MTYQLKQPMQIFNWSIMNELATKPQWDVAYGYKGYGYAIKRTDGSTVCHLPDGLRPAEKELAQFLALAPEMYDALNDALGLLHDLTHEIDGRLTDIGERLKDDEDTKKVMQTLTKLINKIECD